MIKHTPKPWLWPNRTISKQESGILREEHNEAINQREELLADGLALAYQIVKTTSCGYCRNSTDYSHESACCMAQAFIRKATNQG